jgi:hypothetical protein
MSFGVTRRAGEDATDYNLRYAGWCLRASLVLVPLAYLWFKFGPNALDTRVPYFIFCVNTGFLLLPATAVFGWNRFLASYIAISSFPQVATLILAIGWLLVPLNFLYGILLPERLINVNPPRVFGHYHDIRPKRGERVGEVTGYLSRWAGIIFIPLILYLFTRVYVFGGPGQAVEDDWYSHQWRITFGFYAQLVSAGVGYVAAIWLIIFGHTVGAFFLGLRE